jgi:hypothetical protein
MPSRVSGRTQHRKLLAARGEKWCQALAEIIYNESNDSKTFDGQGLAPRCERRGKKGLRVMARQ